MLKTNSQAAGYKTLKADLPSAWVWYKTDIESMLLPLFIIAGLIYFALVIIPIVEIVHISGVNGAAGVFETGGNWSALKLSLFTSIISVTFIFIVGTPAAYLLNAKAKDFLLKLIETLILLPTVLPPAVAGIGLLLAFGKNGSIGYLLQKFDISAVFTPLAVIIAQIFVASGFYVQVLKVGMSSIDKDIIEAAYVQGASRMDAFLLIVLPLLKKPILSGLILAWTRALGEFGATVTFAGNVLDKTRTAPLQIYTLMQTDISMAASLSFVLLLISFTMLLLVKLWLGD